MKLSVERYMVSIVGNAFLAAIVAWTGTPLVGRNGMIVAILVSAVVYNGALYAGIRTRYSPSAWTTVPTEAISGERESSLRLWRQIPTALAALGFVFFIVSAGLPLALGKIRGDSDRVFVGAMVACSLAIVAGLVDRRLRRS